MVQFHVTGIDTTDFNFINILINNIMSSFPNCQQWTYTTTDNTTLDIYIELGVNQ